jgi:hypothetical protein
MFSIVGVVLFDHQDGSWLEEREAQRSVNLSLSTVDTKRGLVVSSKLAFFFSLLHGKPVGARLHLYDYFDLRISAQYSTHL